MNKESLLKQEIIDLYRDIREENVSHTLIYGRSKVRFTDDKVNDNLMIASLQKLLDKKGLELLCEKEGYVYCGEIREIYQNIYEDYEQLVRENFTKSQHQKIFREHSSGGTLGLIYKLEELGFKFYIEEKEHDLY